MAQRDSYGTIRGNPGDDARVVVRNPGQKSALAIVAAWDPSGLDYVPAGAPTPYDVATFKGYLWVCQGPALNTFDANTRPEDYGLTLLFQLALTSVGPHSFFFPLSDLYGNLYSSEGGALSVILSIARTKDAGSLFRAMLNVSGAMVNQGYGAAPGAGGTPNV